jgi:hypothetical protein
MKIKANMKSITITSVALKPFANFMGLMGVATGAIKAIILPVLALFAAGNLGGVEGAIKGVSSAITSDVTSILTFGVGGWVAGAAYAWIANWALKTAHGVTLNLK